MTAGNVHELATADLEDLFKKKLAIIGLDNELGNWRSTGYPSRNKNGKGKAGDSAFTPRKGRPDGSRWPTIVFESGVSESRPRLRTDAGWWMANSSGDVKIVLLLHVSSPKKRIFLEHWETQTVRNNQVTRDNPGDKRTQPRRISLVEITPGAAKGAPVTLSLQKIFLRPPPPFVPQVGEGNVNDRERDAQKTAKENNEDVERDDAEEAGGDDAEKPEGEDSKEAEGEDAEEAEGEDEGKAEGDDEGEAEGDDAEEAEGEDEGEAEGDDAEEAEGGDGEEAENDAEKGKEDCNEVKNNIQRNIVFTQKDLKTYAKRLFDMTTIYGF